MIFVLEFAVSLLVALLQISIFITTWFTTWAILSFAHMFVFNLIKWIYSDENPVTRDVDVDWTHVVNQQISARPKIITYLEVIEPKTFFWSSKQVIWREEKTFEYQHWIDLTNRTKIEDCRDALVLKIDFDIQFDDKETEELYREHVQTLLDELPEYCKNATKVFVSVLGITLLFLYHQIVFQNPL